MDVEKVGLAIAETIDKSTRPVVTIVLTGVLCKGFLHGQVSGDAFLGVVAVIVAFWFKDREAAKDAAATKAADTIVRQMNESKDPSLNGKS